MVRTNGKRWITWDTWDTPMAPPTPWTPGTAPLVVKPPPNCPALSCPGAWFQLLRGLVSVAPGSLPRVTASVALRSATSYPGLQNRPAADRDTSIHAVETPRKINLIYLEQTNTN